MKPWPIGCCADLFRGNARCPHGPWDATLPMGSGDPTTTRQEHGHGAINTLVSLPALASSIADLERTRVDLARARNRLMAIRERLDQVLEQVYRQRSSGTLE